jgi:hypothetical protein
MKDEPDHGHRLSSPAMNDGVRARSSKILILNHLNHFAYHMASEKNNGTANAL